MLFSEKFMFVRSAARKATMATIAGAALFLWGCGESSVSPQDQHRYEESDFELTTDGNVLADRLTPMNQLIPLTPTTPYEGGASLMEFDGAHPAASASFSLDAGYITPTVNGVKTFTTFVTIKHNLAYIAYASRGDTLHGGVDILDLTKPQVIQSIQYRNSKVRIVSVQGDRLLVGTTAGDRLDAPAVIDEIPLRDGTIRPGTTHIRRVSVPGFAVVGIEGDGDHYYVASGTHGGVSRITRRSFSVVEHVPLDDARAVSVNSKSVTVLGGQSGRLYHFSKSLNPLKNPSLPALDVGGLNIPEARASTTNIENWNFSSLGDGGLALSRIVSVSNALPTAVVTSLPKPLAAEGIDDEDAVTNAVSFGPCFVYVSPNQLSSSASLANNDSKKVCQQRAVFIANGGAGITVAQSNHEAVSASGTPTITPLGTLGNSSLMGSANFVASSASTLVVVSGEHVWLVSLGYLE